MKKMIKNRISKIYFLFALLYPFISYGRKSGFLFAAFFLISILSMFSEDTLETQAGATFVALFFSLLLFARSGNQEEIYFTH